MGKVYGYGLVKGLIYIVDLDTLHRMRYSFDTVRKEYMLVKKSGDTSYFHHADLRFWGRTDGVMDFPLFTIKGIGNNGFMLVFKEFGLGLMVRSELGITHICKEVISVDDYLNTYIEYFYKGDSYRLQIQHMSFYDHQATVQIVVDKNGKAKYRWKRYVKQCFTEWCDLELLSPRQLLLGQF